MAVEKAVHPLGQVELRTHGGSISVHGEISFRTAARILVSGRAAISALPGSTVVLDLSAVSRTDSAGLALVVDWMRAAKLSGSTLRIVGVSPQLADIARVSGLEDFLGGE